MAVIINVYSVKQVKETSKKYDILSKRINSPVDAANIIEEVLEISGECSEVFGILTLNTKNEVAGVHVLHKGSLNQAIVCPRDVFRAAILNNAASVICFHNHPSGDPTPSREDIGVTKKLAAAGDLLDIDVLDHIVIGDNGRFASLKDKGLF